MVVKIAHRGDPLKVRENTLASLESAVACGADWVEVDVKLTGDGVPMLLHDDTLRRLWGVERRLADVPYGELEALVGAVAGTRIPTLREALELMEKHGVVLMIDIPGPAEARASLAVVEELGAAARVVFTGDAEGLAEVRAALPDVGIAMSWTAPWLPGRELLARVRPDYVNVRHVWLSRWMARRVHAQGMRMCTWTVDRPRRMARVAALGADAVISNDIAALVRVLG
ncbi:glycerophosphodiester phosphodiesterase [Yinghuangia seranimata]|uniref:glycerophosphodiester phosphodiesterase n=1 Tax=Yinghuangia seranimata TaxID=408067 RepID=UPI00248B6865|nr:glycerophosphodiester phosphodiesterase family protein [Yinghuangia seranimata]MDI2127679.1 glycerophosphodiester phosphodiesterase family protein [Yinghuangia seranimata]